ncbi:MULTISPECIES: type II secretion system F family protein [Candidatus Ichthyocystis]|uniref:Type II secretion system protein F n=1 Tax=Candidatus Ichthyocystis hellenicum TaxID=1561003 RepID=A0A0S4M0N8_9BURK|nr:MULTISPECIES: type II secretion system F family protein [Ichthyocystis]CUT17294.1 type II secretion system protein F [Candidatus Ichthyocystis hellenicum]
MQPFIIKFKLGSSINTSTVLASSEYEAVLHAQRKGLTVLSIASPKEQNSSKKMTKNFDVGLFCEELLTLIDAGLTLKEGLQTLCLKEKSSYNKRIIQDIVEDLSQGATLSAALQKKPYIFSGILIASVRATEKTGNLNETLMKYIDYRNNVDEILTKIKSASIYPLTILSIGSVVILFLLSYVIPKFAVLINEGSAQVSGASIVVVTIGTFVHNHWIIVNSCIAAIVLFILAIIQNSSFRKRLLTRIMSIRFIDEKFTIYRRAGFSRALAMLLESGVDLPQSLRLSNDILCHEEKDKLFLVIEEVEQGNTLSSSLEKHNLSDQITSSLISIGEKSGSLPKMLLKSAIFNEKYFSRWIDRATKIAEPIIMSVLGVMVGGILILMYMPILDLAGSIT